MILPLLVSVGLRASRWLPFTARENIPGPPLRAALESVDQRYCYHFGSVQLTSRVVEFGQRWGVNNGRIYRGS